MRKNGFHDPISRPDARRGPPPLPSTQGIHTTVGKATRPASSRRDRLLVAGAVICAIMAPVLAVVYPHFTSDARHLKEMDAMLSAVYGYADRHGRMPVSMAEVVESMDEIGATARDAVTLSRDYVLVPRPERPEEIQSLPVILWLGPDRVAPLRVAHYGRRSGILCNTPYELAAAIEKDISLSNAIARAIERQHDSPNLREVWSLVQRRAGTAPLRP